MLFAIADVNIYSLQISNKILSFNFKLSCHCLTRANPPTQLRPSPLYPGWQVQVNEPSLLSQVADSWQPPLLVVHSSTSEKIVTIRLKTKLALFKTGPNINSNFSIVPLDQTFSKQPTTVTNRLEAFYSRLKAN